MIYKTHEIFVKHLRILFTILSSFIIPYSEAQNAIYATGSGQGYGMAITTSSPLPIKLLYFEGVQNKDRIDFKWATASELNNNYFTIERSKDAAFYKEIALVTGAGSSNTVLYYSAIDGHPSAGISYYRLKQTDYNGKYQYSASIAINFGELNQSIHIYADRSKQGIYLQYTGEDHPSIQLIIIDTQGRAVTKKEFNWEQHPGSSYRLSLSNHVSKGIYLIRTIIDNKKQFVQKIVY